MRIVNRKEFLALPVNTVYSLYMPCGFDGLLIKVSAPGAMLDDWLYDDLVCPVDADGSQDLFDTLIAAEENSNQSVPLDFEYTGRDGSFEGYQKFAVYERQDVEAMIARLSQCLTPKEPTDG